MYPETDDPDFQKKLYAKRELYYHKAEGRDEIKDYKELKAQRDKLCSGKFQLRQQQALVSNYINPDTPYRGLLIDHGTGTGKTCAGIAIAEKFKPMVQKYGTKIHVLVPGPLVKENWKKELVKCTGETYLSQDYHQLVTPDEKEKALKNSIVLALQYYRIMSYRSFYKKVLGDKIREVVNTGEKLKTKYAKTEEGEYRRDISIDRLTSLNNTLLIIDEAHHLTGNAYGDALRKVISNSVNLKIILLTATPMKNLADDVIELINFIRHPTQQIHRDKIFTTEKNYLMQFKEGGLDYFKKMATGYISYLRGADPITFAKRVEVGAVPDGLLFTKVIKCDMLPFQQNAYDNSILINADDVLDRKSEAVANLVLPALSPDKKSLVPAYGTEGITTLKNQIKLNQELLNKRITSDLLKNMKDSDDLINITDNQKNITGLIYKLENLKHFSIKFYTAINNLNLLVEGKKGPRTAFVYSNLVKVGIEPFEEMLKVNGYLEFQENSDNYNVVGSTVCYYCGKPYDEHKHDDTNKTHEFHPATFLKVTGKSVDDLVEVIAEDNKRLLDTYFSTPENKYGRYMKFVLGSKVMSEAISLRNVAEVHILDVYFNLGQVDQIIGRAIRDCSHHALINDNYRHPEVHVFKYVVSSGKKGELSREEDLYKKSELKYIMIKKIERAMKEVAIDCPLNYKRNIFPEEIKEHENCVEPLNLTKDNKDKVCPLLCDYTKCTFKCYNENLNKFYYENGSYRDLNKDELDYTTFTKELATGEIDFIKSKIKELYKIEYVYTLDLILKYIRQTYPKNKINMFDEYFVYKALDMLIPVTENDFNNFKDIVTDKYNKPGYLIFVDKYYIFQPFDQNEDVPMYYRTTYNKNIRSNLTLYNYLKSTDKFKQFEDKLIETTTNKSVLEQSIYTFDFDYYDKRDENKYVGIIDKEPFKRKGKEISELEDVFKIRDKRNKVLEKKRGTGIPTLKGSVAITKEKSYIKKVAKSIGIELTNKDTRLDISNKLRDKMVELEKYATGKDKMTYVMVPTNHPTYKFPLNLEDRVEYLKNKINNKIKYKIDIKVNKSNKKYEIVITGKDLHEFDDFFKENGGVKENNKYTIVVD